MRRILSQTITGFAYSLMLVFLFLLSQVITVFFLQYYRTADFIKTHLFTSMLLSYGVFFVILCIINRVEKKSFLENYRYFKWTTLKQIIRDGAILIIVTQCVAYYLQPLFPDYALQMTTLLSTQEPVVQCLVIILFAPLMEEYLFREKIQTFLVQVIGPKAGIILQACFFACLHEFLLQQIYTFLLGIGLGMIRYRYKHMMAPTLVHIFFNIIGFL